MKTLFTHCLDLTCSHTLARPHLPEEKIKEFYSVCGRPHGHRYRLEVTHDLSDLPVGAAEDVFRESKARIEAFFEDEISGKDLNSLFGNTAGEALSPDFYRLLQEKEFGRRVVEVAVQETEKNRFVTYCFTDCFTDSFTNGFTNSPAVV